MKSPCAVIFDYDGVIANTMEDNFRSWQHTFLQNKVFLSKEEFVSYEGMRPLELAGEICRKYGLPEKKAPSIVSAKEDYFIKHCIPPLYKGVEKLLVKLKGKGRKTGLVSVGSKLRVYKTTPPHVISLFDVIVTGDDVKKPKPDPEPYAEGMKRLYIKPSDAIVIEDTSLGITSAKAAGAYCIAVCSTRPKQSLTQADIIVEKFVDLEPILIKLLKLT